MNALKPELDIYGNQLSGIYLHRQCERPWKYLRDLVSRAGVVEKTKESLL